LDTFSKRTIILLHVVHQFPIPNAVTRQVSFAQITRSTNVGLWTYGQVFCRVQMHAYVSVIGKNRHNVCKMLERDCRTWLERSRLFTRVHRPSGRVRCISSWYANSWSRAPISALLWIRLYRYALRRSFYANI